MTALLPCQTAPDKWTDLVYADDKMAALMCRGCPVKAQCLQLALGWEGSVGSKYRYGVWGGMTPVARARMAKARVECPGGRLQHAMRGEDPCPECAEPEVVAA